MYYYIMVDPDKPNKCKLGISKSPNQRIKAYRTAAPQCYYHAVYHNVPNHKLHERKILELLKERFVVQSEYVHCPPSLVQNIVEGYFEDNNVNVSPKLSVK